MPILPLPQFESDLAEQDREAYERLKPPASMVVRFGVLKMVGEFPYEGDSKPGCGSKIVIRSHRGTEIGEMLTSTCPNAGCSKSVSRKEMLEYIENSGGKDYPFFSMQGKALRVATPEDLNTQARLDETKPELVRTARSMTQSLNLPMKIVEAEPILGQERLTFYFTSEDRVDFRELVNIMAGEFRTRIDLRQVGARDEARLIADYERCGQHCCCKQFLKVLKPISMKSAKIQKATLDPLKISGRCGRLMCCLRYEDETYDDLRKRLPRKKTRVYTAHGWGYVVDSQILTQLVLVQLEDKDEQIAVPVEELSTGPGTAERPTREDPRPGRAPDVDDVADDEDSGPMEPGAARSSHGPGPRPGPGGDPQFGSSAGPDRREPQQGRLRDQPPPFPPVPPHSPRPPHPPRSDRSSDFSPPDSRPDEDSQRSGDGQAHRSQGRRRRRRRGGGGGMGDGSGGTGESTGGGSGGG